MTGQVILQSAALAHSHSEDDETALAALLEALAREHARLVYRIAFCVLRNHHDAEDVTQEVFLRALRHQHQLAGIAQPKAWLAQIAWRMAADRWRARARSSETDLNAVAARLHSAGTGPEGLAAGEEMQQLLDELLASMPKKFRSVLLLSAVEELNSREISEVLGVREASVRTRLARGRALLREKLAAKLAQRRPNA